MLTVTLLLAGGAFLIALLHGIGKAPLWPAVLLLALLELIRMLPMGR